MFGHEKHQERKSDLPDDMDLDDILRTSNSGTSDYNFLLDNEPAAPFLCTDEEIKRNLPEYLLNTNSSCNSKDLGSYLLSKDESRSRSGRHYIADSSNRQHSSEPADPPRQPTISQKEESTHTPIVADLSDDFISIEDTYKETSEHFIQRTSQNSSLEGGAFENSDNMPRQTTLERVNEKSMTIIEEEDLEESEANLNSYSQRSAAATRNERKGGIKSGRSQD